jgi:hypothetical protein
MAIDLNNAKAVTKAAKASAPKAPEVIESSKTLDDIKAELDAKGVQLIRDARLVVQESLAETKAGLNQAIGEELAAFGVTGFFDSVGWLSSGTLEALNTPSNPVNP